MDSRVFAGLLFLAAWTTVSGAEPVGPFCFSAAPFLDVYEWYFEAQGGSNFVITGRDLVGNRAQSANGFVAGGSFIFGFSTYPLSSSEDPVLGGGTIHLDTLSGPAVCYAPDFESCGAFTIALVSCPSRGSTPASAARVQGRSK